MDERRRRGAERERLCDEEAERAIARGEGGPALSDEEIDYDACMAASDDEDSLSDQESSSKRKISKKISRRPRTVHRRGLAAGRRPLQAACVCAPPSHLTARCCALAGSTHACVHWPLRTNRKFKLNQALLFFKRFSANVA